MSGRSEVPMPLTPICTPSIRRQLLRAHGWVPRPKAQRCLQA
jgi:hypothetical protein